MTDEGGSTWTHLSWPAGAYVLIDIDCPTQSTCYAVGTTVSGSGNQITGGVVVKSMDGGSTWGTSTHMIGLTGIACPTQAECFAVGGTGTVLRTTDGGTTWTSHALGVRVESAEIACPSSTACRVVGVQTRVQDGFVVTIGGIIMGTTDGANTWQAEANYPDHEFGLFDVYCVDATSCYVSGSAGSGVDARGTVFSSFDAGQTWNAESVAPGVTEVLALACPRVNDCVAGAGDAARGHKLMLVQR